jgi:hypothetical protein
MAALAGATTAQSAASIGGAGAFSMSMTQQAIATVKGAPSPSIMTPILAQNPAIKNAFAVKPSYFGVGELGGVATGAQTINDSVDLTVDLTQLANRQDLELGLFDGVAQGSSFSNLTFAVTADGAELIDATFASAAAAVAYFRNNAIDLGSLSSGALDASTLTLTISMSLTTTSGGEGFEAAFLIGDPPSVSQAGAVQAMASAIAAHPGDGAGLSGDARTVARYGPGPGLDLASRDHSAF